MASMQIDCNKLEDLNNILEKQSYICGFLPSKGDIIVHKSISASSATNYPHITRWFKHITSFDSSQLSSLPDLPLGYIIIGGENKKNPPNQSLKTTSMTNKKSNQNEVRF